MSSGAPHELRRAQDRALERAGDEVHKRELGTVQLDLKSGKAHLVDAAAPAVQAVPELSPKELAMGVRIGELLRSRPRRGVFCVDERDWVYPKIARLVVQEWTDWSTSTGKYFGKSVEDRARMFKRALEDFCDQSNGIPGLPPWFTK